MSKFLMALVGTLAMVLGVAVAADPMAPVAPPAPKVEAPLPNVAPLTDETLGQMLTAMGYEYTTEPVKGTVIYKVKLEQDGWTFYLNVALSVDKQNLWVSSNIYTLSDENVPAAKLLRLLEESDNIGPTSIYYRPKFKQIGAAMSMLNRGGITPAIFRARVNQYLGDVKKVKGLCDFTKPAEKVDSPAQAKDAANKTAAK